MTPEELDGLVRKAQGGDKKAFTDLFLALHQELRIFISAHAASVDMVDEVLQAAFVTCYRSLPKYEPRGTFLSWLKGIARNHLMRELTEFGRVVGVEGRRLEQKVAAASLRSLDESESARSLSQCLDRLPAHARDLIRRRYADKRSIREIARDVRKSESWVAVTLFRLREALRNCLAGSEPAYDR
jgi:RNA polymerase sigma-70 factor (ECF subfamily)